MNNALNRFVKLSVSQNKQRGNLAVIYTRVSSKDQADYNGSLETQLNACNKYAESKKLNIGKHFGGTYESAKSDKNRKEFTSMLKYVNKNKSIGSIIVYSLDRFSRTGSKASSLIDDLKDKGIEIISVLQPYDTALSSGILTRDMVMMVSHFENQQRREKCVTGMVDKLRKGFWPLGLPKGYRNLKPGLSCDQHKYEITPEGKLIRKAFKMKSIGISNREICKKLGALGLSISENHLSEYLSNPFYMGYISSRLISGEIYKGHYPPIVSEKIFLQVNPNILNSEQKTRKQIPEQMELPLKGFLKNETDNTAFTGYISQKGSIPYYKTKLGKPININARKVNTAFSELLDHFCVDKKHTDRLKKKTLELLEIKLKDKTTELTLAKRKLKEFELKLEKVEEKFIDDKISQEVYTKHQSKIQTEIDKQQAIIQESLLNSSNPEKLAEKVSEISENLSNLWASSDFSAKRRLQELLFPEGIYISKENRTVRTFRVNTLFAEIPELMGVSEQNKKGESEYKLEFPRQVELKGIEPSTS